MGRDSLMSRGPCGIWVPSAPGGTTYVPFEITREPYHTWSDLEKDYFWLQIRKAFDKNYKKEVGICDRT